METTLERYSKNKVNVRAYWDVLNRIKHNIESYTGKTWDIGEINNIDVEKTMYIPGYPMMIYIRHHGFPSPLLDWTLSPYIALFFAFSAEADSEYAAIYCFIETPEGDKGGWVGDPKIEVLGPYTTTHERHFIQQARYTICVEKKDSKWIYSNHESVFEKSDDEQDYLRKIIIPRKMRNEVLNKLDLMNINEYTLFRNEEGLMKMLAFKEFKT